MKTQEVISRMVEESCSFCNRYTEQLLTHIFDFERIGVQKAGHDYFHLVEPIVSLLRNHCEQVCSIYLHIAYLLKSIAFISRLAYSSPDLPLSEANEAERKIRQHLEEIESGLQPYFSLSLDSNGKESISSEQIKVNWMERHDICCFSVCNLNLCMNVLKRILSRTSKLAAFS